MDGDEKPVEGRFRETYPDFFRLADGLQAGVVEFTTGEYGVKFGEQLVNPTPLEEANVITSRMNATHYGYQGHHRVAIDLDMDAALIKSSTPGHHHLIIDKPLEWDVYAKLLGALRDAGLIQNGYYMSSLMKGATYLRTPWTNKYEQFKGMGE